MLPEGLSHSTAGIDLGCFKELFLIGSFLEKTYRLCEKQTWSHRVSEQRITYTTAQYHLLMIWIKLALFKVLSVVP